MGEFPSPSEQLNNTEFAEATRRGFLEFVEMTLRHKGDPKGIYDEVASAKAMSLYCSEKLDDEEKIDLTSLIRRQVRSIAGRLLGARVRPPEEQTGVYPVEHQFRDMSVFELGGFEQDNRLIDAPGQGWYCAEALNVDSLDYTGIDRGAEVTTEQGHRGEAGKLLELFKGDVAEAESFIHDRQFSLIFGMRFLGSPQSGEQKEVWPLLGSHLVPGGVAFFISESTDNPKLPPIETLKELGLEMINTKIDFRQLIILRKKD